MALSNMQVYNEQIQTNTIELLTQDVNAFNAASGGAIVLANDLVSGDYMQEAQWANISAAKRRVNRYAANTTVAPTSLSQLEQVGVKVAGGYSVILEPSQVTYLAKSPSEAVLAIASAFSNDLMSDQLNTVIGAGVAAISGQAEAVNDVSATAGLTQAALNGGHAKFGDASSRIITDVMTGTAYHKLIENALTNGNELFSSESVTVVSILGKRIVVTDAPALFETGTPDKTKVLGLTAGALIVEGGSDIVTNLETGNGKARIETTWQADYTFVVKVKGYAWDMVNGGKSPDDATLFTATNWDKVFSDIKNTAGVLVIADAAL